MRGLLSSARKRVVATRVLMATLVVGLIYGLKSHYAAANADDLQWILLPTATLVGWLRGAPFVFEHGAGWVSREQMFIIAPECAGVNFMIAALLLLSITLLPQHKSLAKQATLLTMCVVVSYAATVAVNTSRIAVALWLRSVVLDIDPTGVKEMHRVQGIAIFFLGLLVLHRVAQRFAQRTAHG